MKKLIAVMMVLVMVLTFPVSSLAVEEINAPKAELRTNHEYAFAYTEYTDSDNSIIRTYRKQENTGVSAYARTVSNNTASAVSTEEGTKAVLTSLGMSPDFVEELSEEDLVEYANSQQIISTVSYIKTDAEGNVTHVPEEEALTVTSLNPNPSWDNMDDTGGGYPSYYSLESDEYMQITFIVAELGGGRYKYSVDAIWLAMPFWRFKDCIGIAVQNSSVSYGTYSGWFQYTTTVAYVASTHSTVKKEYFTEDNFAQPEADGWDGGAATFWLPQDQHFEYSSTTHSGFKVHFECEATVTNPQLVTVFNATATYDHSLVMPDLDVGVDIASVEDGMGCVLGWGINSDSRIAYFDEPFRYEPE